MARTRVRAIQLTLNVCNGVATRHENSHTRIPTLDNAPMHPEELDRSRNGSRVATEEVFAPSSRPSLRSSERAAEDFRHKALITAFVLAPCGGVDLPPTSYPIISDGEQTRSVTR